MFIKKLFVFVVAIFCFAVSDAQSDVAVGGWKIYPNFSAGRDVDIIDNHLFYASQSGIMRINLQDNSMSSITRIEGMSDVGIQCMKANQSTKTVVICYANSNIDLYQNGRITNIPDLYNKQISGIKTIYAIFTHDKYAYLACGFGIVVVDLKKKIISDSWMFRQNNQDFLVKDIAITQDGTIYAATNHALLKNTITNSNIKNFATWEKINSINTPNNDCFLQIADVNNRLFLLKTDTTATGIGNAIYSYNNNMWEKDTSFTFDEQSESYFEYLFLCSSRGKLIIGCHTEIRSFFINPDNSIGVNGIYNWAYGGASAVHGADNAMYAALSSYGLYRGKEKEVFYYNLQGPANGAVTAMDWKNGKLATVHNRSHNWTLQSSGGQVSFLQDNSWFATDIFYNNNHIHDVFGVVVAPYDSSVVFAASFEQGLLEYKDNNLVMLYEKTNSSLDTCEGGTFRTTSPIFDKYNNLWLGNWGANLAIAVRMNEGNWRSFSVPFGGIRYVEKIFVDSRNVLWLICQKESRLVLFNPNGTPANTADDQWANLNLNLPEDKGTFKYLYCIAEDKDDKNKKMWLGTDKGLKYYSNPSKLLENPDILPEPVFVTKDSLTELLLSSESIRCIKIDGGNRKWIGTDNSGVYLLSVDCKKEIFHFTTENSPLLSNTIHHIEIDGETGEVYFGTEKGLISFRYTATDPKEQYEELKIFPNPVRETFRGYISIEGLKENSEVKITDAQGGLVYRTTSNGGTAAWDGIRFDGRKAATGVYFVFVCDETGKERIAGKILFIK